MDDHGVAVQQTHRLLLAVLAVIGAAIVAAIGLLLWGAHSSTHERSSALDQAIGPLVSAMPSDARPVKNVARSDYRLRTYRVTTDVPTTEAELVAAFHRAGLNAVGDAVSPSGEGAIGVTVPHATSVNVDPVRIRPQAGGTEVELFAHIED